MSIRILILLLALLAPMRAEAVPPPADPLESSQWETMYRLYFENRPVVFDDRIRVLAPHAAEDALAVPVLVDASAVPGVQRLLVVADLNPLPRVLEFETGAAAPRLGFRFKIQQASPIRVAALDADGVWHVAGQWIDATGGGCTLPSVASGDDDWAARLGEIHARLWVRPDGLDRLRFSVVHPMDTGLAAGIPVFHIDTLHIHDSDGRLLSTLYPYEPVSENPVFTLDLPADGGLRLSGRDNNGTRFRAEIRP
ncbi:MAG: quinoprotein dehydrogenase-associated SoxYZ-like carrier [Candidatus Competibacterales bacterium]|nr:quinoprotein dehydrogenase-associated SoxYZ-like carrier [Candidatus Competibacterales bacterium]